MKLKKMFIEIEGKKVLMGEVDVIEHRDAVYHPNIVEELIIQEIKLFRKEGDIIDLK